MGGSRRWERAAATAWDVAPAGLLLGYALAELFLFDLAGPQPRWAQVAFAAATILPLLWRRRAPLVALAVVSGAFGIKGLVYQPPPELLSEAMAYLMAIYSAANRLSRTPAIIAGLAALGLGELRLLGADDIDVGENAINIAFALTGWVGGRAVRRLESRTVRSEQAALVAEQNTRDAIVDERARIARELHDIVSHSIGVTVLQARGGRRMLPVDTGEAKAAFDAIEEAGEQALEEMRRLLGVLRDAEQSPGPQPGLSRLPELVERMDASGLDVKLEVQGPVAKLSPGLELCAYRVIQEALTNCVKHAHAKTVAVEVNYTSNALSLRVHDDGIGPADGGSSGTGHGLIGMRERVALFDGSLETGPDPAGGYSVRAHFPVVAR